MNIESFSNRENKKALQPLHSIDYWLKLKRGFDINLKLMLLYARWSLFPSSVSAALHAELKSIVLNGLIIFISIN